MAKPTDPPETPAPAAPDPVAQTLALLQPWIDFVPQQQRRLGLFICFALAIQAAFCFFLVIDTSVAEMRRESRLYVSVDYPQALAVNGAPADTFWDQLTDPRVFLLPRAPASDLASDLPPLSAGAALSSGAPPPPAAPDTYRSALPVLLPLDQRIAGELVPPRVPFTYDAPAAPMAAQTTWVWDPALAGRHPVAPALPSPMSDTDLSPTELRVAVDSAGTVQHVFVDEGSGALGATGGKDLDAQAVLAAQKIRLDPVTGAGLQWGRVTIFWRYSAKPREDVQPTPPATGP
jgi:hypothetical protein